ncbi:MAG: hypothetical protein ABJ308_07250 [Halieaceae bacterium]
MKDDKAVLTDVQQTFEDHKFSSYEELHSAVESKRLLRELQGMNRAKRWAGFAAVAALTSSLTALGGLGVLVWQSDLSQSFNQRDTLKMRLENLDDDIEDKTQVREQLDSAINSLEEEQATRQRQVADLRSALETLNRELSTQRTLLDQLEETKSAVESQIAALGRRPGLPSDQSRAEIQRVTSQKMIVDAELRQTTSRLAGLQLKSSNLNESLQELQQKLVDGEQLRKDLSARLTELTAVQAAIGFVGEMESGLILRGTKKELVSNADANLSYIIELTNVGNIDENIDLEIVAKASGAITNLVNLRKGQRYAASFDNRLFLVNVVDAIRSDRKKNEKGAYEIVLLNYDHKLVY